MSVALVIHPDGDIKELDLSAGNTLKAMCKAIGCSLVDVVRLTTTLDMWIDDEGVFTQKMNRPATALARRHGYTWQDYYGPVVLCSVDREGNSIDLSRDQLGGLLAALDDIAESV